MRLHFTLALAAMAALSQSQLQNTRSGLIDWFERLTTVSESPITAWTELKRLNVVLIGDSHMEGIIDKSPSDTLSDIYHWRHSGLLRRDFRASLYGTFGSSPPLGGVGFVPAVDSSTTPLIGAPNAYTGGSMYGSWTDHRFNSAIPAKGACLRYTETSQPGAYKRFYRYPAGFSDPVRAFASQPTSYRFVYQKFSGGGLMEVSLVNYAGTTTLSSIVLDCGLPNQSTPQYGHISEPLPATLAGGFWIQVKNVSPAPAPIRWEGVIVHSGDETSGMQIINYACGGSTAPAWNTAENVEALARVNPDVIGVWVGHNDILGRRYSPEQWYQTMRSLIQKIQAKMPKVSIFLVFGNYFAASQFAIWEEAQGYFDQLVSEFRVAGFSLHLAAGRQNAEAWATVNGWKEPFKAHWNRAGQAKLAEWFLAMLNKRVSVSDIG